MSALQIAFVHSRGPYDGPFAQDGLDAAMVAAAFDQEVTLVFVDDGVYQLLPGHAPAAIGRRRADEALGHIGALGVQRILVDRASLDLRGVAAELLNLPAKPMEAGEIARFLETQDQVFVF